MQQKKIKWAQAAAGEIPFRHKEKRLSHESTEALEEKLRESEKSIFGDNQNSTEQGPNNEI